MIRAGLKDALVRRKAPVISPRFRWMIIPDFAIKSWDCLAKSCPIAIVPQGVCKGLREVTSLLRLSALTNKEAHFEAILIALRPGHETGNQLLSSC